MKSQNIKEQPRLSKEQPRLSKEQPRLSKEQPRLSKGQLKLSEEWIEQIGNDMRCSCGGIFTPHMKIEIIEGQTNRKDTTVVYECDECHIAFER